MKSLSLRGVIRWRWHVVCIVAITALAFWLRFAQLGAINLYNDEYYQFETAVGLVETGEYRQYDFYTESVGEPYERAKTYTWQIAQSFKIFGYTEAAARLPAVLWGTLLIPIVIVSVLRFMKNPWVAYATGLLITFDNFFIEMARFTRMYSMVFVLTVAIVSISYAAFTATSKKRRCVYFGMAALLLLLDLMIFEELAMALAVGIGVYVFVRAVIYLWRAQPEDRLFAWLFIIGSALATIGTAIHFAGWHFIPIDAFIYRTVPHFYYLWEVFSELHIPEFGLFFLLFALINIKSIRSYESFVAFISISVLIYFIYFSHRWEAKRYIGFLLPFLYMIIAVGIVRSFRLLTSALPISRTSAVTVSIIGFCIVGPWLSFPGVPTDYVFVQPAYADKTHRDLGRANVETAYQYVVDNYVSGEVVFIQGPRYYYWPDNTIPVVELGEYKSLSFEEFIRRLQSADNGGWVIYNATKTRHLERDIKKFAENKLRYAVSANDSLVFVFHFTPDDVKNVNIVNNEE